jgi:hypothetical protein
MMVYFINYYKTFPPCLFVDISNSTIFNKSNSYLITFYFKIDCNFVNEINTLSLFCFKINCNFVIYEKLFFF